MPSGNSANTRAMAGLRSVAVLEASKGVLIILAGFGVLSVIHGNAQQVAGNLIRHLHLNPAKHYPRIFLEAAGRANDSFLWLLAAGAFAYSVVRFIEAYGLWFGRAWAEWFAIGSGAFYVPFELYELAKRVTATRILLLLMNIAIVLFIFKIRYSERGRKKQSGPPPTQSTSGC
jgi:uncharacterized membrane protein (DUF2068 family)